MTVGLIQQLHRHGVDRPHQLAVAAISTTTSDGDSAPPALTWRQTANCVDALARRIDAATSPDANVLIMLPNAPALYITMLAVLASGRAAMPLAPQSTAAEAATAAGRASIQLAITSPLFAGEAPPFTCPVWSPTDVFAGDASPAASPPLDRSERAMLLLHSTGTTGRPHIVCRTGPSLDIMAANLAQAMSLQADDHVLAMPPMFHSYGMEHSLITPLYVGTRVSLMPGFDVAATQAAIDEGTITTLPGLPTVFEALAQRAQRTPGFDALRHVYSAGAPLPLSVRNACRQRLGLRIGQVYGMTELGSLTYNDAAAADFDDASVGRPLRDVVFRFAMPDDDEGTAAPTSTPASSTTREGHLLVQAPTMLTSYLDDPMPTLIAGAFPTGDLASIDKNQRLYITGRLKLLIDIGGLKVNPLEVEAVLRNHPAVRDCVVLPIRITDTANRLAAVVVRHEDDHDVTTDALRQFVRASLAPHKTPRRIIFRDDLPTAATGKVLRNQLLNELGDSA